MDIAVARGEFVSLLGPSGCGKTTLLRIVAGLLTADRGTVRLDAEDISRRPPHKRDVGVVFQSYALFPHLTVARSRTGPMPRSSRGSTRGRCDRRSSFGESGVSPHALIHPTARLGDGVGVDPGAVVGPEAEVGAGSRIGACSVIGARVRIGRNCAIAAHVSLSHVVLGDRVILHPGVRIGQDGFGYAMGPPGPILKDPQLGSVIVAADVEIGAGSTIDRGTFQATRIGEGDEDRQPRADRPQRPIGQHYIIVAQVGIAGSTSWRTRRGRRPDRDRRASEARAGGSDCGRRGRHD